MLSFREAGCIYSISSDNEAFALEKQLNVPKI